MEGKQEGKQFAIFVQGDDDHLHPDRLAALRAAFGRSYQIVHTVTAQQTHTLQILCLHCGRASANLRDIEERYCGHCHRFHEDEDANTAGR